MCKLADGSLSTDYKVGDEFEVVEEGYFHKGSVVKLLEDDESDRPLFEIVCGDMKIDDKHYEYWSSLKPRRKQFTKADLKDGMVVTYRKGGFERLVFDGELFAFDDSGISHTASLDKYEDSLLRTAGSSDDIIKVSYMNETLWERQEETAEQKEIKRLHGVIEDAQETIDNALEVINNAKHAIAALDGDK